ncbi:MAG: hypothetical protein MJ204_04020 [Bacteroidales bacterium]|nr:hypothetical protein [Bacteroidales bacterium]MCQ2959929.1 hypothetical protein [Bacteroidales bacterium]
MVSKHIRFRIEEVFGKEIRYPLDCEALAIDISQKCNERISASTLKRFFGFISGTEPRTYTLDVIAKYIGYKNWDEYLEILAGKNESSEFVTIEEIKASNLSQNDTYEFCYEPMRKVTFQYKDSQCVVLESINSKLQKNDLFVFSSITKDYPLLISSVVRNSMNLGALTLGKVSGITSIKKIQ